MRRRRILSQRKRDQLRDERNEMRADGLRFKVHTGGARQDMINGTHKASACGRAFFMSRSDVEDYFDVNDGIEKTKRVPNGKPPLEGGGPIVPISHFAMIPARWRCQLCNRSIRRCDVETGQVYLTAVEGMLFGLLKQCIANGWLNGFGQPSAKASRAAASTCERLSAT